MEYPKEKTKPKLARKNARKNVEYEPFRSAPGSPSGTSFSLDEQQFRVGLSLGSFRVHGGDGARDEMDRFCKTLGLSGTDALSISDDEWQTRNSRLRIHDFTPPKTLDKGGGAAYSLRANDALSGLETSENSRITEIQQKGKEIYFRDINKGIENVKEGIGIEDSFSISTAEKRGSSPVLVNSVCELAGKSGVKEALETPPRSDKSLTNGFKENFMATPMSIYESMSLEDSGSDYRTIEDGDVSGSGIYNGFDNVSKGGDTKGISLRDIEVGVSSSNVERLGNFGTESSYALVKSVGVADSVHRTLAPPPSMSVVVSDCAKGEIPSSWDLLKGFAPDDDDDRPSGSTGRVSDSSSDEEEESENEAGNNDAVIKYRVGKENGIDGNGNDDEAKYGNGNEAKDRNHGDEAKDRNHGDVNVDVALNDINGRVGVLERFNEEEEKAGAQVSTSFGEEDEAEKLLVTKTSTGKLLYQVSFRGRFKVPIRFWSRGKLLGKGSFGTVFEAISDTGSFFAVKEVSLTDQGSNAKQCISQLEQEIALLSQFQHENIVQYIGTDKEPDKLYILLELVPKGSLAALYQEYSLGDSQVRAYTRQILTGLKYLHDRSVVHRDIKCANILVDSHGSIKLADFGLAKEISNFMELKSCKGSVYWMAPEVIDPKKTYWTPADIWSLGCTVLEMLCQKPPYSHLEWQTVLWKVGHGEPPPIPNSLSKDAKDFIHHCLKVDPHERPSAADLLNHPFVRRSLSEQLSTYNHSAIAHKKHQSLSF